MSFSTHNKLLFSKIDLETTLEKQIHNVSSRVEGIDKNQFLSASAQQIHDHVYSEMEIEPIILYEDKAVFENVECKVDVSGDPMRGGRIFRGSGPVLVPGIRVIISIPFSGDPNLWHMKPSTYDLNPPRGNLETNTLQIIIEHPTDLDQTEIKIKILHDQNLKRIKFYLDNQKIQIEQYNKKLSSEIYKAIETRQNNLKKHENLSNILGIPLIPRKGAPEFQPLNVKRKIIRPLPTQSKDSQTEKGIYDKTYEHILKVVRHEGRTFETTPKTFQRHDEEELRDIITAHLNGHYEGGATGETFRKKGKTDIRIEDQNRAAFIAECKVWRGKKGITEAIDQLLSYLIWRDCKAAIIIFNKDNAKFSELLQKTPEAFEGHPKFLEKLECNQKGEWRYLFNSEDDENRKITIHVFLFNLFVETATTG